MIVTVVIPCRNEEAHIEQCIRSIYESKLESGIELEVLVVDGMSDDSTIQVIDGLRNEVPSLRIVPNEARVTPVAFNLGITEAKGEFVQIIGARQLVSDNYIQE